MLLALTGYEAGLLVVAAVFIAFALIVALVIPRSRPEFPAPRLAIFLVIAGVLFVSQITAVLVLAEIGEAEETTHEAGATETTTEPTAGAGDAGAGKQVFVSIAAPSCGGCHTLADAGTTGTVGPNLDAVKPSYDKALVQVTEGGGAMPPFKDSLSEQQIQDVAAYVSSSATG